ncbi:MAG: DUF1223 domain-containing protein, partial [Hyphomicrobiaceae bacterium]
MRSLFRLAMIVVVLTVAGAAQAQTVAPSLTVVELFTSQGCSSCPAADALFKAYAARRDLVALSMPVDYWDYLGWKDTLASPKCSKRQRAYAKVRGDGQVYTPQLVVNGRAHVNGASKNEIEAALKAAAGQLAGVAIKAVVDGGLITIDMPVTTLKVAEATVWLAVVQAEAVVEIRAGENRGRNLTYYNVVRDLVPIGMWNGTAATIKQQTAALSASSSEL